NINVVQAGGGGTNGEQTITVHNVNGGTYKLEFTDPKGVKYLTADINWNDGASTIKTDLLAAQDEAQGSTKKVSDNWSTTSITVTPASSSPTGDPVFKVDFVDKLAGLQVPSLSVFSPNALVGPSSDGVLRSDLTSNGQTTNDATFAVSLVDSPAIAAATRQNGVAAPIVTAGGSGQNQTITVTNVAAASH